MSDEKKEPPKKPGFIFEVIVERRNRPMDPAAIEIIADMLERAKSREAA